MPRRMQHSPEVPRNAAAQPIELQYADARRIVRMSSGPTRAHAIAVTQGGLAEGGAADGVHQVGQQIDQARLHVPTGRPPCLLSILQLPWLGLHTRIIQKCNCARPIAIVEANISGLGIN